MRPFDELSILIKAKAACSSDIETDDSSSSLLFLHCFDLVKTIVKCDTPIRLFELDGNDISDESDLYESNQILMILTPTFDHKLQNGVQPLFFWKIQHNFRLVSKITCPVLCLGTLPIYLSRIRAWVSDSRQRLGQGRNGVAPAKTPTRS